MDSTPPPSGPADDRAFTRFSALVKRELGAEDVRILEPQSTPSAAPNVLFAPLLGGRHVAVTFGARPDDSQALLRRLEILTRSFAHALDHASDDGRAPRPPVALSLHDELRALAQRARAFDALILDAHSPIVWGAATSRAPRPLEPAEKIGEALERLEESRRELFKLIHELSPDVDGEGGAAQDVEPAPPSNFEVDGAPPAPPSDIVLDDGADDRETPEVSLRAMREVRELPGIAALRRGRPLVHVVREPAFGYVARSFAGIYLMVLAFDAPFDELRAERVITEAMPKIERLVLALPPLDPGPAPSANVIAFRRRRR